MTRMRAPSCAVDVEPGDQHSRQSPSSSMPPRKWQLRQGGDQRRAEEGEDGQGDFARLADLVQQYRAPRPEKAGRLPDGAGVEPEPLLHLHPAFRHAADAHAVAGFTRTPSTGGALRIFEPNFGELLVPY